MKTLLVMAMGIALTAGAQQMDISTGRTIGAILPVNEFGYIVWWRTATPIDPHFTRTPYGWQPSCPKGMTLVRHDPAPDCIWTGQPLNRKPVYGQFECVDTAKVMKLSACSE